MFARVSLGLLFLIRSSVVNATDRRVCEAYLRQLFDMQWNVFASLGVKFEDLTQDSWRVAVAGILEQNFYEAAKEFSLVVDPGALSHAERQQQLQQLSQFEKSLLTAFAEIDYDRYTKLNLAHASFRLEFIDSIEEQVPPLISVAEV